MKKYISRTRHRLTFTLLIAFCVLLLIGNILENGVLRMVSIFLFIVAVILLFATNRCPHCGDFFRGLYWSRANAGYCRKCGELMEFDDR